MGLSLCWLTPFIHTATLQVTWHRRLKPHLLPVPRWLTQWAANGALSHRDAAQQRNHVPAPFRTESRALIAASFSALWLRLTLLTHFGPTPQLGFQFKTSLLWGTAGTARFPENPVLCPSILSSSLFRTPSEPSPERGYLTRDACCLSSRRAALGSCNTAPRPFPSTRRCRGKPLRPLPALAAGLRSPTARACPVGRAPAPQRGSLLPSPPHGAAWCRRALPGLPGFPAATPRSPRVSLRGRTQPHPPCPPHARHSLAHRPLRLSEGPAGRSRPPRLTQPPPGGAARFRRWLELPGAASAFPLPRSPHGGGSRTQVRAGRCQAPLREGPAGCGGSRSRRRGRAEGGRAQLDRREGAREGGAGGCARRARVSERAGGGGRGEGSGRLRRGASPADGGRLERGGGARPRPG